jgi:hypothetical protein
MLNQPKTMQRLALFVLLAAAATLALAALMSLQGARSHVLPLPELQALVLRFELARSVSEVAALLGAPDSPQGQRLRATLNLINTTDCFFALAYPLLNVAMVAFVAARRARTWVIIAAALALAMAVGDLLENRALIALASAATPDLEQVRCLQVATSVKWGSLYLCTGVLGAALLRGGALRRTVALLAFSGAALGLFAVLWPASGGLDPRALAGRGSSALIVLWLAVLALAIAELVAGRRPGGSHRSH